MSLKYELQTIQGERSTATHGRIKNCVVLDIEEDKVEIPAGSYVCFLKERPSDTTRNWNRALIYPQPENRKYPATGPVVCIYPDGDDGFTSKYRPVRGKRTLERSGGNGVGAAKGARSQ